MRSSPTPSSASPLPRPPRSPEIGGVSMHIRTVTGLVALGVALVACTVLEDETTDDDASGQTKNGSPNPSRSGDGDCRHPEDCTVRAQVIATGIPGAGAICQVGEFHRGGPLHDDPVR